MLFATQLARGEMNRADTVIGWLAEGRYFEMPCQFVENAGNHGGMLRIPRMMHGPGSASLPHPSLREEKQLSWAEIETQAEVLRMCGDEGVKSMLRALGHQDFYVRVIAALALDHMLGVKYITSRDDLLGPQGLWRQPTAENELIARYTQRAKQCYPAQFKSQGKPGAIRD